MKPLEILVLIPIVAFLALAAWYIPQDAVKDRLVTKVYVDQITVPVYQSCQFEQGWYTVILKSAKTQIECDVAIKKYHEEEVAQAKANGELGCESHYADGPDDLCWVGIHRYSWDSDSWKYEEIEDSKKCVPEYDKPTKELSLRCARYFGVKI